MTWLFFISKHMSRVGLKIAFYKTFIAIFEILILFHVNPNYIYVLKSSFL